MSDAPQFRTAEYASQGDGDRCKTCDLPIVGSYYRVNNAITCPVCAEKAAGAMPKDSSSAFARGLLFGIAGAALGLVIYSAVGIITGLEIGYVSLAVGYIVARAMMLGSAGLGGRRYQIAAVLLTYAAVSLAAVPIGISLVISSEDPALVQEESLAGETSADAAVPEIDRDEAAPGLGTVVAYLVAFGLISPFLGLSDPVSGLIGLVILFVGMQIAWRITAGSGIQIRGPYNA